MKKITTLFLFLSISFIGIKATYAAPSADGIEFWNVFDAKSETKLDHTPWQNILDKYLLGVHPSGVNRFKYSSVSDDDVSKLNNYVDGLEKIDPRTLNKDEQEVYWINLYNAATVELILKEKPGKSISEIRESFFSLDFGPWGIKILNVAEQEVSLNDIEHGILRPFWQEPRHHFALNCASIGCPNLSKTAFTVKNKEQLLENAAIEFINHERGAKLNNKGELTLSSIFDWYGTDFGDSEEQVLDYIQDYRLLGRKFDEESISDIDYDYDWDLNKP